MFVNLIHEYTHTIHNTEYNMNSYMQSSKQQMHNERALRRQTQIWCWTVALTVVVILLGREIVTGADETGAQQKQTAAASAVSRVEKPVLGGEDISKPALERWLVLPVSTDLQRVWCGTNAQAFVLVDGEGFRENRSSLDAKALDLKGLRRQLQPYAEQKGATVVFYIPLVFRSMTTVSSEGAGFGWKEKGPTDYVTSVLECTLEGFGRRVGFQDAAAATRGMHGSGSNDWNSYVSTLHIGVLQDALREEAGVGNDHFGVYPVQTALSRLLFGIGPGGVDCVLVLQDSIIGPEEVRAIEESVASLNLKQKRCLVVASYSPPGPPISQSKFYRERLGFAELAFQHLPDYPSKCLNTHK